MKEAAISQGERDRGKLLFVGGRNEGEGESSGWGRGAGPRALSLGPGPAVLSAPRLLSLLL